MDIAQFFPEPQQENRGLRLLTDSQTNWTVSKKALFGPDGEETPVFGIFRDDTKKFLGSVGSKYTITQNAEIVEMLMEASERVNVPITRGGVVGNGAKVYYQFKLEKVRIGASDNLRYLTALTSHDGSTGIGLGTTNVTVVCQNTFYQAFNDMTRIKHTKTSKERLNTTILALKESIEREYMLIEKLVEMSKLSVPASMSDEFICGLFGLQYEVEPHTKTRNIMSKVREAVNTEFNTHGETAYGLFNAVTRYTNHIVNYHSQDSKRQAIMFGSAKALVDRALPLIHEGAVNGNLKELVLA